MLIPSLGFTKELPVVLDGFGQVSWRSNGGLEGLNISVSVQVAADLFLAEVFLAGFVSFFLLAVLFPVGDCLVSAVTVLSSKFMVPLKIASSLIFGHNNELARSGSPLVSTSGLPMLSGFFNVVVG